IRWTRALTRRGTGRGGVRTSPARRADMPSRHGSRDIHVTGREHAATGALAPPGNRRPGEPCSLRRGGMESGARGGSGADVDGTCQPVPILAEGVAAADELPTLTLQFISPYP